MPEETLKEWLKVRITKEEKAEFTEEADKEGLSLSSWMRTHLKEYVAHKHANQR